MESLYKKEDYCNLDAAVVALLEEELPEDASLLQIQNRVGRMKLQQATILGNSTYAAKMLEQAIDEGSRDRTAHALLQQRMDELQERISKTKRNENKAESSAERAEKGSKTENDDGEAKDKQKDDDNDSSNKDVDPIEHERLKTELKAESARVDLLNDLLENRFKEEISSIKAEQDAIQQQEARLRARIRALEKTIVQLPDDNDNDDKYRSSKQQLLDKLAETTHYTVTGQAECIACHDRDAVLAVIPCGHLCLCEVCVKTIANVANTSDHLNKQCPCCRGQLLSTVKIYTTK